MAMDWKRDEFEGREEVQQNERLDGQHDPKNPETEAMSDTAPRQYTEANQASENVDVEAQNALEVRPGKPKREKKGKERLKHMLTAVTAGVIGSVLTLTAYPFIQDVYPNHATQNEQAVVSSTPSSVHTKKLSAGTTSVSDMVEQASKAIVGIENMQQKSNFTGTSEEKAGTGSGVIWKIKDGTAYIVTNNHVIEGASSVKVSLKDGKSVSAKLVGTDPLTDIAVIKVKYNGTDMAALPFGDSKEMRAGDSVWAIGNPLGLELSRTVTEGIVSAVDRSIPVETSAGKWNTNVIQTDAAISPGNSGGALINASGQVIGINSMKIAESGSEGLGFAIPSNDVVQIVNQIMEKGKVDRPYLGVAVAGLEELPENYLAQIPDNQPNGVLVVQIDANSPAGKAGIQQQDVITAIDGKSITSEAALRKQLYEKKVGDKITIAYTHNGKAKKASVVLKENQKAAQQ